MDLLYTTDLVRRHEGAARSVYTDSTGHLTIGVGFNLERRGARMRIEALGLDYEKVCAGEHQLEDIYVETLFKVDLEQAIEDGAKAVANFHSQPDDVQAVIVDMIFNLGLAGFEKFRKLIVALERKDYCAAGRHMRDSRWFTQVGNRAIEDVAIVEQYCADKVEI